MITLHNPITQSSTDLLMLLTALIKSLMVVGFVNWFVGGFFLMRVAVKDLDWKERDMKIPRP